MFSTLRLVWTRVQLIRQEPFHKDCESTTSSKAQRIVLLLLHAALPGVLIGIAYGIWNLEVNKTFCTPSSFVQGHAIWHVMAAVSVFLSWQFLDQNRHVDIDPEQADSEADLTVSDEFSECDADLEFGDSSDTSSTSSVDQDDGMTSFPRLSAV